MKTEEMEAKFQQAVVDLEVAAHAVELKGKFSEAGIISKYLSLAAPATILLIIKRMREAEAKKNGSS